MQADEALVSYIAHTYYEMTPVLGSIRRLPGYDDRNFFLTDAADNKSYVLKIVNRQESVRALTDIIDEVLWAAHEYCQTKAELLAGTDADHFVVPRPVRTSGNKLSTYITVRHLRQPGDAGAAGVGAQTTGGQDESLFEEVKCNIRLCEYFDGATLLDYINNKSHLRSLAPLRATDYERLYARLGRMCSQLFVCLGSHVRLVDALRTLRAEGGYAWQLRNCEPSIRANLDHLYPRSGAASDTGAHPRRLLVERALGEFNAHAWPKLALLPEFVLHSDLSHKNILLAPKSDAKGSEAPGPQRHTLCLIDFQDLQVGPRIVELAVLMLYSVLGQEHTPFKRALELIPRWLVRGYQSAGAAGSGSGALAPEELQLAPSLMKLRLCQSLLNGLRAIEREPENAYVLQTNQRGWQLLELMCDASTSLGRPQELASLWLAPASR